MQTWDEIKAWRKLQRSELIAQRLALPAAQRAEWGAVISTHIEAGFALLADMTVGFCWPFKGEFDARFVIRTFRDRGARAALPAVVEQAGPLQFRLWRPGVPMSRGVYDIPAPDGTEIVAPDAAIVPMNGFDAMGYRLGYGGGYFDRTLAVAKPRPLAIGVSFEFARLPTLYPQAHDIPMDFVVTEAGIHALDGNQLVLISSDACRGRAFQLATERGLSCRKPRAVPAGYSSPPCYAAEFPGYVGGDNGSSDSDNRSVP